MAGRLADIPTVIPVVAAALVAEDRRILMHRRRLGSVHGGLWEFPGGKLEPGESAEMALVRELEEELGIGVDPANLCHFADSPHSRDGGGLDGGVVISLYICRAWRGEPQCLEGEAIGWFARADMLKLAMPPLDVPLAHALDKPLCEG